MIAGKVTATCAAPPQSVMAPGKPRLLDTYNGAGGLAIHQEGEPTRDGSASGLRGMSRTARPIRQAASNPINRRRVFWLQKASPMHRTCTCAVLPGECEVRSQYRYQLAECHRRVEVPKLRLTASGWRFEHRHQTLGERRLGGRRCHLRPISWSSRNRFAMPRDALAPSAPPRPRASARASFA